MEHKRLLLLLGVLFALLCGAIVAVANLGPSLVENISNAQVRRAVFSVSQVSAAVKTAAGQTYRRGSNALRAEAAQLSGEVADNMLRYARVQLSGNRMLGNETILQAAGLSTKPYFWKLPLASIKRQLDALAWVKSSALSVQIFPLRLAITIEEHTPWMVAEYEGHSWILSQAVTLVAPMDSVENSELIMQLSELPRLAGLQPSPGVPTYLASSNARLQHAASVIRLLDEQHFPFSAERYDLLDDGSLKITPKDARDVPPVFVLVTTPDEAEQVSSRLTSVLKDLKARGEMPGEIDMRFKNQAVIR